MSLIFDPYTQEIPNEKKNSNVFISINRNMVDIFIPREYQQEQALAELLHKKGFGEEFAYSWYFYGKPTVYFSPLEYLSDSL